jgi:hypothetical protein
LYRAGSARLEETNKVDEKNISKVIAEQILQEYYRGFDDRVKKFGFKTTKDAVVTFLKIPEFREFFVAPGEKLNPNDLLTDTTHLATLEYLMDKMEDVQSEYASLSPESEPSEEDLEDVADEVAKDAKGVSDTEVKAAAKEAEKVTTKLSLKGLRDRDLESALGVFRNSVLKRSPEEFQKQVKDAVKGLLAAAPPYVQRKMLGLQVPAMLKIGDEITKILSGDLDNLKEDNRR